jgi:hypothetical protein
VTPPLAARISKRSARVVTPQLAISRELGRASRILRSCKIPGLQEEPAGAAARRLRSPRPVTLRTGQKVDGRVIRSDDFIITLGMPDGTSRSFRRDGDVPKVEIHNPREGHLKLLPGYTDKDIHDVTAYLVTVK